MLRAVPDLKNHPEIRDAARRAASSSSKPPGPQRISEKPAK